MNTNKLLVTFFSHCSTFCNFGFRKDKLLIGGSYNPVKTKTSERAN